MATDPRANGGRGLPMSAVFASAVTAGAWGIHEMDDLSCECGQGLQGYMLLLDCGGTFRCPYCRRAIAEEVGCEDVCN